MGEARGSGPALMRETCLVGISVRALLAVAILFSRVVKQSGAQSDCLPIFSQAISLCDLQAEGKEAPSTDCCDVVKSEAAIACITAPQYASFVQGAGYDTAFVLLQQACGGLVPPEPEPPARQAAELAWTFGVCLASGSIQVVWGAGDVQCTDSTVVQVGWMLGEVAAGVEVPCTLAASGQNTALVPAESLNCSLAAVHSLRVAVQGSATKTPLSHADVFHEKEHTFVSKWQVQPSLGGACGSWLTPCTSLEAALSPQGGDQMILVAPGTYEGEQNAGVGFSNTKLNLRSLAGANHTVLNCTSSHQGPSISARSEVVIDGLQISGCVGQLGAGLRVSDSHLVVVNSILSHNRAIGSDANGGGAACQSSLLEIRDSEIFSNQATHYGAGIYARNCSVTIHDTQIRGNELSDAGRGGGIAAFANSSLYVVGATIQGNNAYFAGAVMLEASSMNVSRAMIKGNSAQYGGGILLSESANAHIEGSTFGHNNASHFGGGALILNSQLSLQSCDLRVNAAEEGGALYSMNSAVEIGSTSITGNSALIHGGGLASLDCGLVDTGATCVTTLRLTQSFISGNAAPLGGGLYLKATEALLDTVKVSGNRAQKGGGLLCTSSSVEIIASKVVKGNEAIEEGGAVASLSDCSLAIDSSEMSSNVASLGGAIYMHSGAGQAGNKSSLSLKDTLLDSNVARIAGGGMYLYNLNTTLEGATLRNNSANEFGGALNGQGRLSRTLVLASHFANNTAFEGGAVWLGGLAEAKVTDASFLDNVAGGDGGGFCILGAAFDVAHTTFVRNQALRGAGIAVNSDLSQVMSLLEDLAFSNNSAIDGSSIHWMRQSSPKQALECTSCSHSGAGHISSDVATEALSLGFSSSMPAEIQTGRLVPPFGIGLLDFYGNVTRSSAEHQCRMLAPKQGSGESRLIVYGEGSQETTKAGIASFSQLAMEGRIGETYSTSMECAPSQGADRVALTLNHVVRIAHCLRGEEPAVGERQCVDCEFGSFNFDGKVCKLCPRGGVCPGKDVLQANRGWWRPMPESEVLYLCPKPESCSLGNVTGDLACSNGYLGPVCALCGEGYYEWGSYCRECNGVFTYVYPLLIVLTMILLVVIVLNADWDPSHVDQVARMNMIITYIQVLGRLNYYGLQWPMSLSSFLGWFDVLNVGAKITAPRCMEEKTDFYFTYLLTMLLPFVVVGAYAAFYLARRLLLDASDLSRVDRAGAMLNCKMYCYRSVLWLLTFLYLGVSSVALQIYGTRLVDGKVYLHSDYSIVTRADGGLRSAKYMYVSMSGILCVLLYPIGIPLGIILLLRRHKDNESFREAVGFLQAGYRHRYYFWEVVDMLRVLLISAVPICFPYNSSLQNCASQTIIVAFLVALLWHKPYRNSANTFLQAMQQVSLWLLVTGGILLKTGDISSEAESALVVTLSSQMVLTSLVLLASWVVAAAQHRRGHAMQTWQRRLSLQAGPSRSVASERKGRSRKVDTMHRSDLGPRLSM